IPARSGPTTLPLNGGYVERNGSSAVDDSTWMTSAPCDARYVPTRGPAAAHPNSTTRTPSRAWGRGAFAGEPRGVLGASIGTPRGVLGASIGTPRGVLGGPKPPGGCPVVVTPSPLRTLRRRARPDPA